MKTCNRKTNTLRLFGVLAWCAGGLLGCHTPAGSSGFASVEIGKHSTEEILITTAAVSREDGYTLRSTA